MLYRSLTNDKNLISFEEAVLKGLSPDGSLYVPKRIPILDDQFIKNLPKLQISEICKYIIKPYIGKSIPDSFISNIINDTLSFPFPLKKNT